MRCEDLSRELASPTGRLAPSAIAGHLADCPSCSEQSRRARHLDQIWEATRPLEPSDSALDGLWARASLAIDASMEPVTLRLEGLSHRRRRWIKPAQVAAQIAAMLLIAATFLFFPRGGEPVKVAIVTSMNVNAEPDQTVVVEIGKTDAAPKLAIYEEPVANSSAIPEYTQHDVFSGVEGMLANGFGSVASR